MSGVSICEMDGLHYRATITGFPLEDWTVEQWQHYIDLLSLNKSQVIDEYRALKAERKLTMKDMHRHLCRVDRLGEFISRAKDKIAEIEKR